MGGGGGGGLTFCPLITKNPASNLTMDSSMELSIHACDCVLKALDREEDEGRIWLKLISKLIPKIEFFSINQYTYLSFAPLQKSSKSPFLCVNYRATFV